MPNTKYYVLRTHSLLIPDATLQFDSDNVVVIPMAVLEDLKNYQGYPEDKKAAKDTLKYIESLGINQLTQKDGVKQKNGSVLRVLTDATEECIEINHLEEIDRRCFQICLKLKKEGKNVILISNNEIIRMKAKLIGIAAEAPRFKLFPELKNQYKGKLEVYTSNELMQKLYDGKSISIEGIYEYDSFEWLPNLYLTIKTGENGTCLARFDGNKITKLDDINLPPNFKGKNRMQRFLIDALYAPVSEAPVIFVKGQAGTGKTHVSLTMSLFQTEGIGWRKDDRDLYGRTLIAAPMVDETVKKIGALPGGVEEKVNPYVAGILDNLNDIMNYSRYFKVNIPADADVKDPVRYLLNIGKIRLVSLDLLRGRTFPNVCFIIDEAQNIRPSHMKTIATRIGEGSKFIFLGDPSQVDAPDLNERYNGLTYLSEVFKGHRLCRHITFDRDCETVRSEFAREAAQML